MFLEIITLLISGIGFGIITGLIPGIHINLVSLLLLGASAFLLQYLNPLSLAVFIIAMSITHTFLNSIPSIFLGAPEAATALGVLPGHRYLLKGQGLMALKLTIIGSFGAILLSFILFPLSIPFIHLVYPFIKPFIGHILLIIVILMIFGDRLRWWALFIFLASGMLGLLVFNLHLSNPLFPMLSGLFGVSTLLLSIKDKNKIPKQKETANTDIRPKKTLSALFSGQFSGFLTSIFPGLGAAQAAIISMQITPDLGDHGFMVLMGAINTVNFTMSLATMYVLNKARNGSLVAVSELTPMLGIKEIVMFLIVALVAGSIAVFLAFFIGRIFSKLISKVNYLHLVISIILLILILSFVLSGPMGLLVVFISTSLGTLPALLKTKRSHAMGCLLLPVIIYFIF